MKLNVKQEEWVVRKPKKIGERNLEQEVNWRARLKKFRLIGEASKCSSRLKKIGERNLLSFFSIKKNTKS